MSELPVEISVIIPTRAASADLAETLRCLAGQTLPPGKFEVIVASGETEAAARAHIPAQIPYPLRIISCPGSGAARRRNAGAAVARGALLVFLDDDMAADPLLLQAHFAAHQCGQANQVVIGYFRPLEEPFEWLEQDLRSWWEDVFQQMADAGRRWQYTDVFSGNVSLPARLFAQVGGFDEDLLCHEDWEIGLRLLRAGASFSLNRDARACHRDKTDLPRSVARKRAEGRADVQLARRYPWLGASLPFARQIDNLYWPSRVLRTAAAHSPAAGVLSARLLMLALRVCEYFRLRGLWRKGLGALLLHSYWQGILSEASGWAEVRALAVAPQPAPPATRVDVCEDVRLAVQAMDQLRPDSVCITWNGLVLGKIPALPGAEPLRGRHLVGWLRGPGALPYARARALFAALEKPPCPAAAAAPEVDLLEKPLGSLEPSQVLEVELTRGWDGLQALAAPGPARRAFLRLRGRPAGWLHLPARSTPRACSVLLEAVAEQLNGSFIARKDALVDQNDAVGPQVSVVICTRGRPELLEGCLKALSVQQCAPMEVIVVDNASPDDRTARAAAAWGARCVREDRPGLDFARNRGLVEARAPVVAYLDDDARPATDWVAAISRAFALHPVAAVTGMVAPAALDTPEQCLFEWIYGGMGHGLQPRLFRRELLNASERLWASGFGVGTNMAFRRDILLALKGFDPALDVGGPAGGGGDVEMFHRLVAAGYTLYYEPAVLVWHLHRRDMAGLRRQMVDNGRSFGAYLLTCARNRTESPGSLVVFALLNWGYGWLLRRLVRPGQMPRDLVLAEVAGALSSPLAYMRAVRRIRRLQA